MVDTNSLFVSKIGKILVTFLQKMFWKKVNKFIRSKMKYFIRMSSFVVNIINPFILMTAWIHLHM